MEEENKKLENLEEKANRIPLLKKGEALCYFTSSLAASVLPAVWASPDNGITFLTYWTMGTGIGMMAGIVKSAIRQQQGLWDKQCIRIEEYEGIKYKRKE